MRFSDVRNKEEVGIISLILMGPHLKVTGAAFSTGKNASLRH